MFASLSLRGDIGRLVGSAFVIEMSSERRLNPKFSGRYFAMLLPLSDAFLLFGTVLGGALVAYASFSWAAFAIFIAMAVPVISVIPSLRKTVRGATARASSVPEHT